MISTLAWFVTKKEIDPVDLDKLDQAFKHLEKTIAPKIKHYYRTRCPQGHEADVMYVFWVRKISCTNCGKEVRLFPSFRIATKNSYHTVFCPHCYNLINGDLHISRDLLKFGLDDELECPACGKRFIPSKGYSGGGKFTCSSCGQKDDILRAVRRLDGPPPAEMFALEYYCSKCGRGYKRADEEDIGLFEEARAEFERSKSYLLYPRQAIPEGLKTRELLNHGYRYFYQMFNERQLLCLAWLLEGILGVDQENAREYLLLTLSAITETNNTFCRHNELGQKIEGIFARHAYWPINTFGEGNVWGTFRGRGSFSSYYPKTKRAKSWWLNPDGLQDSPQTIAVDGFEDLKTGKGNVLLKAQTSEDLFFIPDRSVDTVITDPPYHDNVMYAELADFFYVWLRLGLKDRYPEYFGGELSPKAREIVKNEKMGKGDEFFMRGLTRIFKECQRVLKDDGLFVFTFHHAEGIAWKKVLQSIVEVGFYVEAVYPVHSEMKTSTHIMEGGISYDIPFVCRKRSEVPRPVAWESLKDEIYLRAEESVGRIKKDLSRQISDSDLFVIVMGRCLELYSRHWPQVLRAGEHVRVEEAIEDIQAIVDSLLKSYELKQLPVAIDETTKLYLLYIAGQKSLSHDDLNKRLQTGGGSLVELEKRQYIIRSGKRLAAASPKDRMALLHKEIEKGDSLPLIDLVHYLYAVYESGKPVQKDLARLGKREMVPVLGLLHKKTGDRIYAKLAEMAGQVLATAKDEVVMAQTELEFGSGRGDW